MRSHLAGIVPVSGQKLDFNMPWHDSLMPIAPDYLAVERAVAECAYAGCTTIWLICSDDVQPLIRYQIGEKIEDPVYAYRHFEYNKQDFKRYIRIYYVPIDVKDIAKRDCLSWSVIYGVILANKVITSVSKWVAPKRYYIAWPYGGYDPSIIREHRRTLTDNSFMLAHNGGTIKDNKYLGFNMTLEQAKKMREEVREKSTGLWADPQLRTERLSTLERFSYRNFDLSQVFDTLDTKNYKIAEVKQYHSLDNWDSYCKFLNSNHDLQKPKFINYHEWNEIGKDD